jgi:hypothetical protein
MQENPFAPLSPAPVATFVNRRREVDLIFGHLRAAQRGNVTVSGPLGIGKTSLLRYVADPDVGARYGVAAPGFVVAYLDVQSVTPFSADRFWRRVAQRLTRQGSTALAAAAERCLARAVLDVVDLEELLDDIADQDVALVLLLDEFEWVLRADTPEHEAVSRDFLAELASLARRSPRVLSLVVATERPLHEATRVIESWRGSPFATLFTSVALRPLSREDADALVDVALSDGAVHFGEEERQLIFASSGGQPAAMQAAAFALFHGRQQGLHGERLRESARGAAARALEATSLATPPPPVASAPIVAVPHAGAVGTAPAPAEPQPTHGLWIDAHTGEVWVVGRRAEALTALEYNLLRLLVAKPERLCTKDDIIRQVWGEEFMSEIDDSRVEKLVSRLRRKVEPVPGRPQYVRTVRGRGYRYVP